MCLTQKARHKTRSRFLISKNFRIVHLFNFRSGFFDHINCIITLQQVYIKRLITLTVITLNVIHCIWFYNTNNLNILVSRTEIIANHLVELEAERILIQIEMANLQNQIAEFRQAAARVQQELETIQAEAGQIGDRLAQMVVHDLQERQMDGGSNQGASTNNVAPRLSNDEERVYKL